MWQRRNNTAMPMPHRGLNAANEEQNSPYFQRGARISVWLFFVWHLGHFLFAWPPMNLAVFADEH
jgi:hypothetical protein